MAALLGVSALSSSCVVSKKTYEQAVRSGKKSLDSLNRVFNEAVRGFNESANALKCSNSSKDLMLDSLERENQRLAGDKASLSQSLISSIDEYNQEKERLARKTRTADSLMSILAMQAAEEDSLRRLDDNLQRGLQQLLLSAGKCLQGLSQSQAFVQEAGGAAIITVSNDFLFKSSTSAEISAQGLALLKKIAALLTLNENARVQAVSGTDSNGQAKALLELSARRAAAVVSELAQGSTLPGAAYTASGRGMYSPAAPNTSDDNKKKNRRTEIIIIIK